MTNFSFSILDTISATRLRPKKKKKKKKVNKKQQYAVYVTSK
jgi:hypothetical protein